MLASLQVTDSKKQSDESVFELEPEPLVRRSESRFQELRGMKCGWTQSYAALFNATNLCNMYRSELSIIVMGEKEISKSLRLK
jgi:hypothetical protein